MSRTDDETTDAEARQTLLPSNGRDLERASSVSPSPRGDYGAVHSDDGAGFFSFLRAEDGSKTGAFKAAVSWLFYGVGALALMGIFLAGVFSISSGVKQRFTPVRWPADVGYAGPTPTGAEAFAAATAYPSNHDHYPLREPVASGKSTKSFNILEKWGNLSPWYSVPQILNTTAEVPNDCELKQIHLLHRHGARYPTSGSGPAAFARKVAGAGRFVATQGLEFLNSWRYELGSEILTPFGRTQLFELGVGFRVKYGSLLVPENKPVFRTESQDRMHKSALNFAAGFFGIPYEDQYHQLLMIEAPDFNNTLAPYYTCPNGAKPALNKAPQAVAAWRAVYLRDALARLQPMLTGLTLDIADVAYMQEMCAYETVSIGGSAFCELFTEEEWDGFEYAMDLDFWYGYSFGHPAQAAIGLGWTQEWLSRVQHQRITTFNSSTNASYLTGDKFPLDGQNIFVDATHDTIISAVVTTLNLASLSKAGPLPTTHIPANRSFVASELSPFAANLQAQVMSCSGRYPSATTKEPTANRQVRWILNDRVLPLDHIVGCGHSADGLCDLGAFVTATKELTNVIDYHYDCWGDYEVKETDSVTNGRPPASAAARR